MNQKGKCIKQDETRTKQKHPSKVKAANSSIPALWSLTWDMLIPVLPLPKLIQENLAQEMMQ